MKIWFTADTHFSHRLTAQQRGFASPQEQDEKLIQNWNAEIKRGDRVYHLGDFAFGSKSFSEKILRRLNGEIFLILGNHDRNIPKSCFSFVKDTYMLKHGGEHIWLSHYPHEVWPQKHYGSFHLHGHCHGNIKAHTQLRMDVGVDPLGLRPIEFEKSKLHFALDD